MELKLPDHYSASETDPDYYSILKKKYLSLSHINVQRERDGHTEKSL